MTGKYRPYPAFKPSGVEWSGDIPATWNGLRFKNIFSIKKRIAGKLGFDILSITQKGIKIKDITSGDGQLAMDYSKYQMVYEGDFAMNHMDLLTGYVDISKFDGVTSPDYRVFSLKEDSGDPQFLLYILQHCYNAKVFFPLGQGAAHMGRWRLPADAFNGFTTPVPPLPEQTQIAAFLDHETAKIDALIAKQQRLIALLEEKRQAVISHAVTKGLNPDASLHPSGIDWLGDVPAHWTVKRIKRFSMLHRGYDLTDTERTEGIFPVVTSGGVNGSHGAFMVQGPGIVTGRYGSTGRLFYIEEAFWPHNTTLFVSNFFGNFPKFVWYSLRTVDFETHSAKAAVPGIDRNDIHVLHVAVPPVSDQREIVKFLDSEMAKFDTLAYRAQSAITLLKERRTALISAAVTGKIDVRDWQPPKTDSDEHLGTAEEKVA